VYQFLLAPLVLHCLIAGNAKRLTDWATELEPTEIFFNFIASHDALSWNNLCPSKLLDESKIIQGLSFGVGKAGADFGLVTNRRIAEFKFIKWQRGSETESKKTLFQDYYKLVHEDTEKRKFMYVLNTELS
jgi:hypothetical protein